MEKLEANIKKEKNNIVENQKILEKSIDEITYNYEELNTYDKKEKFINDLKYIETHLWEDFIQTIIEKKYKWTKLEISINDINELVNELKNIDIEKKNEIDKNILNIKNDLINLKKTVKSL